VTARHAALAAASVAVLGMGVYLFIQVRATPAQAHSSVATRPVAPDTHPETPRPPPTPGLDPAQPHMGAPVGKLDVSQLRPNAAERPQIAGDTPPPEGPNVKLDAIMDQANHAYDKGDFDEAKAIAGKVLSKEPTNVRMLRIMVSSSCILGDNADAQKYYEALPKYDRDQMKTRCDRYGVSFKDPAQ
jgi:hypothetical protein